MQLKHKIAALSILPLLLAVAVVCALVLFQNQVSASSRRS